nr:hypothetical protein [Tanacetum cinerariifolium]
MQVCCGVSGEDDGESWVRWRDGEKWGRKTCRFGESYDEQ